MQVILGRFLGCHSLFLQKGKQDVGELTENHTKGDSIHIVVLGLKLVFGETLL